MGQTKVQVIGEGQEEKKEEEKPQKTARRAPKPRQRGKRYLEARAKVDPQKEYSFQEAAKLVRETSISGFPGSVELHLVLGKGGLSAKTEKKAPLAHLVVAKVDQPERKIEENLKAAIEAVGAKNIKKAVVSASMGPGIKLQVA